jgi:hypothetical protein
MVERTFINQNSRNKKKGRMTECRPPRNHLYPSISNGQPNDWLRLCRDALKQLRRLQKEPATLSPMLALFLFTCDFTLPGVRFQKTFITIHCAKRSEKPVYE